VDSQTENASAGAIKKNELRYRVVYAFLMMGGGMFAAIAGGIAWAVAAAFVMAVIANEWVSMAKASKQLQLVLSVLSAFCGLVFVVGQFELKVIGLLVFISAMTFGSFRSGKVAIIGSIYLGLSGFAFASLRAHPENGILYIFGLFSVVWATDSAAYAFGRIFKGPKLMPIISPNKTWAGFIGGSLCGMLAASIYSILANLIINPDNLLKTIVPWTLVGLVLTLASQFGDLLESWVKRFFGVKDSSNLIPGHGGILDRLDGHLCAALILAIILAIPGLAEQLT